MQSRRRVAFELPAQRSSVGVARVLLTEWLHRWQYPDDIVDTAKLVISEFVTNAICHTASSRIDCRLVDRNHRLRIEVSDQGAEPAGLVPRRVGVDATGGRGLHLVDILADNWGDSQAPDTGRVVWAELRLRAT